MRKAGQPVYPKRDSIRVPPKYKSLPPRRPARSNMNRTIPHPRFSNVTHG